MRNIHPLTSTAVACGFAFAILGTPALASPPDAKGSPAVRGVLQPSAPGALSKKTPAPVGPRTPALDHGKLLGAPLQADLVASAYFRANNLPEGFPGIGFCDPNPAGGAPNKIRLRIVNQGAAVAAASVVRVDFLGGGSVFVNTPALAAGAETSGAVNIPQGCYPPGFSTACQFTVHADSAAQVQESQEGNNSVQSFCVGPAG